MENASEASKRDLILGDDFENALSKAAEVKNTTIGICKERNRGNYDRYFEIMLGSRTDVQEAMSRKGRNKTDQDRQLIKDFKKNTSKTYRQVCDLLVPEDVEEGEMTRVQKMVDKIATVLQTMEYIGNTEIRDELAKRGISVSLKKMEDENEMFLQDHIRENITDIFSNGRNIREDMGKSEDEIKTTIFESSVPVDLQYDKSMNPTGIKSSDFCKLVDLKARMIKAQDDESKEKLKEIAENIMGDHVFQNARNDLMNRKLQEISV